MIKTKQVFPISLSILLGCIQPVGADEPVAKSATPSAAFQLMDFASIQDFAVASDGSLWILDTATIQHFKADGKLIKAFGDGIEPLNFRHLALAADGSVWVSSWKTPKIEHYNVDWKLIATINVDGADVLNEDNSTPGYVYLDIQTAADGSVWLLDALNARVLHYKSDGTLIKKFGAIGDANGAFKGAKHIGLAQDGSVWVSDGVISVSDGSAGLWTLNQNYRLQHFSADGNYLGQFDTQQNKQDTMVDIRDIAIASDGSLWTADQNSFKHFKTDGTLIGQTLKSEAIGSGASPASHIALAKDGSLWTVSGNRFLRNRAVDLVSKKWAAKSTCMTEYDDINNTVYLWGVTVGQQSFDAILQAQNGVYQLMSTAVSALNCAASVDSENQKWLSEYDATTNLLNIPYALVSDVPYKATFKYQGDEAFILQSADKTNRNF